MSRAVVAISKIQGSGRPEEAPCLFCRERVPYVPAVAVLIEPNIGRLRFCNNGKEVIIATWNEWGEEVPASATHEAKVEESLLTGQF